MNFSFCERFRRGLSRLSRAREGSVAIIFAIAMIPITLAAGIGLDAARAMANRQNLQDALDSTALALAHLPAGTSQTDLQTKATAWLNANLNTNNLNAITLTVTPGNSQILLVATSSVPTTLTQIVGFKSMPISTQSTVNWGVGHVEVALVLDNTGSMSDDNKLTSLVSAAKTLVTTLLASNTTTDPSAVKISIVPFSNTVNIGSTYQTASWMDPTASAYAGTSTDIFNANAPDGSGPANRFTLLSNMGVAWGGCVETRPQWVGGVDKSYDVTEVVPSSSLPGTQFVPYFAPDEPDTNGYVNSYLADGVPSTGTGWQALQGNILKYYPQTNCTQTKGSGRNQTCKTWNSTTPTTGNSGVSGYKLGPNFGCGIQPLQRLTTSATPLNTLLGKMVASGDTNVPMGLFWGWMTLSPNAPFGDGVAYGTAQVTKIIIILTDGANHSSTSANVGSTVNRSDDSYYSGVGYDWQHLISTNPPKSFSDPGLSMNDREAKICDNMKTLDKIVIYAVPLEVTDPTAQSLLKGCATNSDSQHYLNVSSSSQLAAAFANIAGSIGQLRIAQ